MQAAREIPPFALAVGDRPIQTPYPTVLLRSDPPQHGEETYSAVNDTQPSSGPAAPN
jgi:hypothetical protein